MAATLLLGAWPAGPVVAAEDPAAAVEALFEAVVSRELGELDGVVCRSQQEAVREAFGDSALGLDLLTESLGELTLSLQDLVVETPEETTNGAAAEVSGSLIIEVDESALRDFVRELVEIGADPGDPPITEAEIDATLPLLDDILDLDRPIEAEFTFTLEDGGWVVCGGFDGLAVDLDELYGTDPMVSAAGLCALASPAELSGLNSLEYDSSIGDDESCTYSQSDWDEYHATTLLVVLDTTLDDWREIAPPESEFEVGGAEAFSSDGTVYAAAGDGVLLVSVSLPDDPPAGMDAVSQAIAVSELFLPRLGRAVPDEVESAPAGPSLCEAFSLEELNTASGRAFDGAEGGADHCTWTSSDAAAGLDTITATVTGLTLDEFRDILGATVDDEIEGLPAISTPVGAVIELADGRTLDVSVYYDEGIEPTQPAHLLALTLVERLAPLVAPEAASGDSPSAEVG